jgi:small-conductance mechanosensitive channel
VIVKVLKLLIILTLFVFGEVNATKKENNATIDKLRQNAQQIAKLRASLIKLNKQEPIDNEWTKTYDAYIQHKELLDSQKKLSKKIKSLKTRKKLTKEQKKELKRLNNELKIITDKINLIKNFEKEPFKTLIAPPSLNNKPEVKNPFALISALSYIKEIKNQKEKYENRYKELEKTISALQDRAFILRQIVALNNSELDKKHLKYLENEIKELLTIKDIFKTTKEVYEKKFEEVNAALDSDIKRELEKVVYIGVLALIFLALFIFLKFLTAKYLAEKDSYYTVNKVINISFITVILLILLFAYLENVNYLITILGFASAGIAIAMKDWFMSLMGWFVIVFGGTIHVGDRVKFSKDGKEFVGDVVDISLLRITIQEDVTLTTYMVNRRAGRIIFVPNNYIFTEMIANYSHSGLKTVWDGIDFYITFDSNTDKALKIAKDVAKRYSKGYTELTRKQLNKLRSKYQLKNTNVEPRVFSFIEGFGMKVSVWYLTNSYATLTLRSTISQEIIKRINQESDIEIAYPTQSIYLDKDIPKPIESDKNG